MSGDTPITVVGNLVDDLNLKYLPNGTAVANGRIASTPRKYDSQSGQWVDGDALFLGLNIWRQQGENAAAALTKGTRVIVSGVLRSRSYETREGEKRTVFEVEVEDIGPSLKFATASVTRSQGGGQQQNRPQGGGQGNRPQGKGGGQQYGGGFPPSDDDPWN